MIITLIGLGIVAILVPVLVIKQTQFSIEDIINRTTVLRWNSSGITVAGNANFTGATPYNLFRPVALSLDRSNNMYITDCDNNRIQKCLQGVSKCTTIAGQPNGAPYTPSNSLYFPFDATIDMDGNIYIADSGAHRIAFWSNGASSGTTIAGTLCMYEINFQYKSFHIYSFIWKSK